MKYELYYETCANNCYGGGTTTIEATTENEAINKLKEILNNNFTYICNHREYT